MHPLKVTVDHATSLSEKGSHTWDNVQLMHNLRNVRKGKRIYRGPVLQLMDEETTKFLSGQEDAV